MPGIYVTPNTDLLDMLDKLLKISSLSGAVLIFCGVLKLIIYYSAFDIKIVEFLRFSEIITSFLDDINILLIYGLAMIIQSIPLLNYMHRRSKLSADEFYNTILIYIYRRKYRFISFFIGVAIVLCILLFINVVSLNYLVIYVLIFCVIQSLTYLVMSHTEESKIEISDASAAVSVVITVGIAILLLAQRDIQETKSGRVTATIHLADKTIVCNRISKQFYIGKTDDFLFVRRSDNTSICIPISEIKQIDFR